MALLAALVPLLVAIAAILRALQRLRPRRAPPLVAVVHVARVVLVVDDEHALATAVARLLRASLATASVEIAGSGAEALAAHARRPYDVIVVDVSMPTMSGPELVRQLRARGDRVRVLLMSALADEADLATVADECGANDWISKPIDADAVVAKVRALLHG